MSAAVLALAWLSSTLAYEDMAMHTCLLMDPFDSALPSTDPFPYDLISSKTGLIHNQDSVIFKIKSKNTRVPFKRFMVHVRDKDSGVAVGKFLDMGDADIMIYNCFLRDENTAIEFDTEPKTEVRMRWMPNDDYNGTATFFATVVQSAAKGSERFWLRQPAETLHVYNPWFD